MCNYSKYYNDTDGRTRGGDMIQIQWKICTVMIQLDYLRLTHA